MVPSVAWDGTVRDGIEGGLGHVAAAAAAAGQDTEHWCRTVARLTKDMPKYRTTTEHGRTKWRRRRQAVTCGGEGHVWQV